MGEGDVQIEEQEINDMTVEQTVGEIAEHACQKQTKPNPSPRIVRLTTEQQYADN